MWNTTYGPDQIEEDGLRMDAIRDEARQDAEKALKEGAGISDEMLSLFGDFISDDNQMRTLMRAIKAAHEGEDAAAVLRSLASEFCDSHAESEVERAF